MAQNIASAELRRRPGRSPVIETAATEDSAPAFVPVESSPEFVPSDAPLPRRRKNPFGSREAKLAYPPRPGYHRRWFNDVPGRIETALEGGWTHVRDKDGKSVVRRVGVAEEGGALNAYLLEIRQEWYDEDMAAQQAEVDKIEGAMRRGEDSKGAPGFDGRYLPSQGIKITHGRG
jgi:hypothetical protein